MYPGFDDEYVRKKADPNFGEFVCSTTTSIPAWSATYNLSAVDLYAMWKRRFTQRLKEHGKSEVLSRRGGLKYEADFWTKIHSLSQELIQAKLVAQRESLRSIVAAGPSIGDTLVDFVVDGESSQATGSNSTCHPNDTSQSHTDQHYVSESTDIDAAASSLTCELSLEEKLHTIAYKRLAGNTLLTEDEKATLSGVSNDGTAKGGLLYVAADLLAKDDLKPIDECVIKLCLTGIINFLNPIVKHYYAGILQDFEAPSYHQELVQLDTPLQQEINDLLAIGDDSDALLTEILSKKARLAGAKERGSDSYIMLSCLEHLVESFGLWNDDDESELTFYRRFASLLDHLFKNTDIKLCDGETGSSSSKAAKDLNKAIFYSGDLAATYPRKIDLLYKCTEVGVSVELSANEWKKSKTGPVIANSQQSKNLRVNASILSHLVSRGVYDTLAMEWIGNSGYLYQLTWIPNERVYLATLITTMHIPTDPTMLDDAVVLMRALFMFKAALLQNAKKIKVSVQRSAQRKRLASLACVEEATDTDPSSSPDCYVFFTPKSNRIRRATIDYSVFD